MEKKTKTHPGHHTSRWILAGPAPEPEATPSLLTEEGVGGVGETGRGNPALPSCWGEGQGFPAFLHLLLLAFLTLESIEAVGSLGGLGNQQHLRV